MSDYLVHVVNVRLVKTDGFALDELLNKDFVRWLWVNFGETYVYLVYCRFEFFQVFLLFEEKQLLAQDFL